MHTRGGGFCSRKRLNTDEQAQQRLSPDSTGHISVLSGLLPAVHQSRARSFDISWRFHLQLPHVNVKLDLSSNVRLASYVCLVEGREIPQLPPSDFMEGSRSLLQKAVDSKARRSKNDVTRYYYGRRLNTNKNQDVRNY